MKPIIKIEETPSDRLIRAVVPSLARREWSHDEYNYYGNNEAMFRWIYRQIVKEGIATHKHLNKVEDNYTAIVAQASPEYPSAFEEWWKEEGVKICSRKITAYYGWMAAIKHTELSECS